MTRQLKPDLFSISITFIFLAFSGYGIAHHEIWLDEAQHFLLARDSHSLSDLFYNCRYEGHPYLWNLLLFIVTRFTDDVSAMQILHILISTVTVWIILGSKLSKIEKVLLIFSYFIFYEYNIISRNYGLSAMFAFLSVRLYSQPVFPVITFSIVQLLLSNSHLFGFLFSVSLVTCIILTDRKILKIPINKLMIAAGILICGWFITAVSIMPPHDYMITFMNYESSEYMSESRILKTLSIALKGIFYIPELRGKGYDMENSLWLFNIGLETWQLIILSLIAIAISCWILRRDKFAISVYGIFLLLFLSCEYFLPLVNGIRYFGFIFIGFAACYMKAAPGIPKSARIGMIVILLMQFANGIYFWLTDIRLPFTNSKLASEYLISEKIDPATVFISDRTMRPAISAYTGFKYFGIETGTNSSYCKWYSDYSPDDLMNRWGSFLNTNSQVIIIGPQIPGIKLDSSRLELLKSYDKSMAHGQQIYIYRYSNQINSPAQQ